MAATTGYQAAPESNDAVLSYAVESAWGVTPAVAFQAIRFNSETLAGTKSRSRPSEINATGEESSNVTQSEAAGGAINFSLSYGTFDDLFSCALNADWGTAISLAGVAGDIALTNVSATVANLVSTTANKFQNIVQGQFIRLLGFTNAANNAIYKVATVTDTTHLVLTSYAATVTETPTGTLAQVRGGMLRNGTIFKSLAVEKKLSSAMFLEYSGLAVTGMQLGGSVGQFFTGSFTVVAKSEVSATTTASTGAVLAAPTGRVHDTVAGVGAVLLNDVAADAVVDSISFNVTKTGAAAEYGIGSSTAQGMIRGTINASGSLKMYFKSFTDYALFKSETQQPISLITKDAAGNAYVITFRSAAIMNPNATLGGPNQPVMGTFTLEGNPASGGGTVQIDRLSAT